MSTVIIKNTTVTAKTWGGVSIAATSQRTIEEVDRLRLLSDSIFLADLLLGYAVVSNGSIDYSAAIGLIYLRGTAIDYHFNNVTNGFIANNVQAAIEEIRTKAGKSRFGALAGFDGNATVGRYLEFNSNVDSNISGFVVPVACKIRELTCSVSAKSTVTFQIRNWAGSVLTSISLSAARNNTVTGLSVALAAGTELRVYVSAGLCARPLVNIFIEND